MLVLCSVMCRMKCCFYSKMQRIGGVMSYGCLCHNIKMKLNMVWLTSVDLDSRFNITLFIQSEYTYWLFNNNKDKIIDIE